MKINNMVRTLLAALTLTMIITTVACNSKESEAKDSNVNTDVTIDKNLDTRFQDVNYDNREFRVYTSVDSHDSTNANEFIEGSGEQTGDLVNDAVYMRNLNVEEMIGVKLKFIHANYTYVDATTGIRTVILAGDDAYDIIVNDIRSLAELSIEGLLNNISDVENFDFDKNYWYKEYINDLQIIPGRTYILAGDYFMDIITSCHTLFHNKQILDDIYSDPDYIYKMVFDGAWTCDEMYKIISEAYIDINGDNERNEGDRFGFTVHGTWGDLIPFMVSTKIPFVDRSSGYPEFAFNNDRSVSIVETFLKLWYSEGTFNYTSPDADGNGNLRRLFANNTTIFVSYQRLGDLAKMRDIEFEIGVTPYPKFEEKNEYITASHDTTEVGAIPVTSQDINFVSTVLEVLNRETALQVIPEYYETALKIKYISNEASATMIDIIHDGFGSVFPLAYSSSVSQIFIETFANCVRNEENLFVSTYESIESAATAQLEQIIQRMENNIN